MYIIYLFCTYHHSGSAELSTTHMETLCLLKRNHACLSLPDILVTMLLLFVTDLNTWANSHRQNHTEFVFLCLAYLTYQTVFKIICGAAFTQILFLLWLNKISLYVQTTFCLWILLYMNIWVIYYVGFCKKCIYNWYTNNIFDSLLLVP